VLFVEVIVSDEAVGAFGVVIDSVDLPAVNVPQRPDEVADRENHEDHPDDAEDVPEHYLLQNVVVVRVMLYLRRVSIQCPVQLPVVVRLDDLLELLRGDKLEQPRQPQQLEQLQQLLRVRVVAEVPKRDHC